MPGNIQIDHAVVISREKIGSRIVFHDLRPDEVEGFNFSRTLLVWTPPGFDAETILSHDTMQKTTTVNGFGETHLIPENIGNRRQGIKILNKGPYVGSAPQNHPASRACYWLKVESRRIGFLLQEIKTNRRMPTAFTTCHYHEHQIEHFHVVSGQGTVFTRNLSRGTNQIGTWESQDKKTGDSFRVLPMTAHVLVTNASMINFIVMVDPPVGNPLEDHHYVFPPPDLSQ